MWRYGSCLPLVDGFYQKRYCWFVSLSHTKVIQRAAKPQEHNSRSALNLNFYLSQPASFPHHKHHMLFYTEATLGNRGLSAQIMEREKEDAMSTRCMGSMRTIMGQCSSISVPIHHGVGMCFLSAVSFYLRLLSSPLSDEKWIWLATAEWNQRKLKELE